MPRIIQLTPPGRGAIASLLIEGSQAVEIVDRHFRSRGGPLARREVDRLAVGRIGPEPGEEIVARRCADGSVELHGHGGMAAVTRIVDLLAGEGCEVLDWRRWCGERPDDRISTAAWVALADARTQRTAGILLDQHQGALRRALNAASAALENGEAATAAAILQRLLSHAATGLHLITPWRVVVAGEPNVGKSSLINALLGFQRAIVAPTPGTTRDVVTAVTAVDGWPVELADTAGLRTSAEPIEQAGVALARERLAAADLVLLVFDASRPWSVADGQLAASMPQALVVHNKCDVPSGSERPAAVSVSAHTGEGIDRLLTQISHRLVLHPIPPGEAAPFLPDDVAQLQAAAEAIASGETASAATILSQL